MTQKFFVSTFALMGMSTVAFANGDHSGSAIQVIAHMLTEPDHLAMLSLVVVAAVFAIRKIRSTR
jgi:hypothetical protein